MEKWDLNSQMKDAINDAGGFVCCHAHFDKSFYITREGLDKSNLIMHEKWNISDDIKRNSTQEDIEERIRMALDIMVKQGVKLASTFIDAYEAVDHRAIDAANKVKEEYKDKITLLTATQPLGGLIKPEARKLYEEITAKADFAGGLPSYDRPNDDESLDILFSIAKNLNKKIQCHIDQDNIPSERDTEKLIKATKKHGYEGKVTAVHAVSTSAQPKDYRTRIYKEMAEIGMGAIACPSAMLSQKQFDQYLAPIHNSLLNAQEMIEAGMNVGLGVDNIADFYVPFCDGDMWVEMRMLQEACRYRNFEGLVKIATEYGRKILLG